MQIILFVNINLYFYSYRYYYYASFSTSAIMISGNSTYYYYLHYFKVTTNSLFLHMLECCSLLQISINKYHTILCMHCVLLVVHFTMYLTILILRLTMQGSHIYHLQPILTMTVHLNYAPPFCATLHRYE